ncbi:MAG: prepilin-type N-terminal cleavage/methylation domain-containing protein [Pseudonocardia sp.]|nr:prepilin-type N-terminal cleavage/methylation domain-containing protein [Pseudonocardia sp.]
MRKLRDRKETGEGGFTLVELLIVIVILGILAAIVVLAIGGLKGSSQKAACNSEGQTIATAEDAAFASTGAYKNGAGAGNLWISDGNTANLLKSDPTPHFTVVGSATGYSITPTAACPGADTLTYGTP